MLTAVLIAASVAAGTPWPLVGVLAAGLWSPLAGLAVVVVVVIAGLGRSPGGRPVDSEAVWCGAMAAELRAGSSLRHAIDAASARVPELGLGGAGRLARAGVPIARLSDEVAAVLPHMRVLVGPALRIAAESGGAATGVFGRLAVRSIEEVEAQRERRIATTQVRLSAMVIAALPLVVMGGLVVTGRAAALVGAGPIGAAALLVGGTLQATGVAVVWVMSRRAGA